MATRIWQIAKMTSTKLEPFFGGDFAENFHIPSYRTIHQGDRPLFTLGQGAITVLDQSIDPVSRSLRWLQPIRRRVYSVPGPNALWHIDSYMKLIRWSFVIHGGIDGFCRMIVYLGCSNNNCAATVLGNFQQAVGKYGVPSRVRSDFGAENNAVERLMQGIDDDGRRM